MSAATTAGPAYVRLDDSHVIARFISKVSVNESTGCWEWTGGRGRNGYAVFYPTSRATQAHRWAYLAFVAEIPADRSQLDHLCRVRHCVNPEHLQPVDNRENQRRGDHPLAGVAARTNTCPRGHSLADAYLRTNRKTGTVSRCCRPCQRRRYAEYQQRKADQR